MNSSTPGQPLDERGLPIGYPFRPEWEVTPRAVRELLVTKELGPDAHGMLLDCRREDEWQRSRIEGSVLIPMQEIERRLDEIEDDDGRRDRPIVVLCHHGMRSMRVTGTLRALGFANVRSMAGGIDLWSVDIDPSVPRY